MVEEQNKRQGCYLSYLLRLWRENGGDRPRWRASLEQPRSGERQAFTTLVDLFAFLEQETGVDSTELAPTAESDLRKPNSGS